MPNEMLYEVHGLHRAIQELQAAQFALAMRLSAIEDAALYGVPAPAPLALPREAGRPGGPACH